MVQEDWMDVVKPHCLTLGNVRKFEKGQSYKVVCFHRNFEDELSNAERCGIIEQDKRYTAQDFFQKLQKVDVYMHREGVSGQMHFAWDTARSLDDQGFTFHGLVESKDTWYPFDENGNMPIDGNKHHSTYPDDTFVGYRGYMILYDNLVKMPDLVIDEGDGWMWNMWAMGNMWNMCNINVPR